MSMLSINAYELMSIWVWMTTLLWPPPRLDYEKVANLVRSIVGSGHMRLVETLAERIAEACLTDARVRLVRIRVEKLDVFPDAVSAGVEIERRRAISSTR
jgi:hypothetical protein